MASRLAALARHLRPSPTHAQPHLHELNPAYFLPRAAAIEPAAVAIVHRDRSGANIERDYFTEADRVRRLAAYFKRCYKDGTKIGILAPNTPMFFELMFGIAGSGHIQAAFNYRLSAAEIRTVVELSAVDVVFVDIDYLSVLMNAVGEGFPDLEIVVDLDTDHEEDLRDFRATGHKNQTYGELMASTVGDMTPFDQLHFEDQPEDKVFALSFTSGTTGKPKAVEYTHRGMYLAAISSIVESELNRGDKGCRYLWTLPMFHAAGWSYPFAVTAVRGSHVCLRKMDYTVVWEYLTSPQRPITHYNAAPTVNIQICEHANAKRLPERVLVTVAASPPSPSLFKRMVALNLIPVHVYGLTETYGPITRCYVLSEWSAHDEDQQFKKMSRQGHGFLTAQKARVVKPSLADRGELVDVERNGKEVGEILLQGNTCMKGYHNDEKATQKVFAGGWLHTGDLAVWHPDGAVEIMDRNKDIIISGGENISSVGVENVMSAHPDVVEVAVIGIPDAVYGERPKALIILRASGKAKNPESLRAELIEFARGRLGGFEVPREIEFVDELPKTSTGKVKKHELRKAERMHFERSQNAFGRHRGQS
ncbi:hypothetical protein POJ06DRAFT_240281 [Lipomyces tetrasporus]|uniref:Uncharacterized protein n=1 Tax=Lipomyces tetrasporus TaxID=54092 RepID=A0AAD7QM89_9ASCO|nr:uncharacterized protein POJ06DRAFT_240281 [Lipomyces tetrasporus]KAJ8097754.1 hypothetical protein POJ06DRAFT_240281 [Lipomyces tetrasporus]